MAKSNGSLQPLYFQVKRHILDNIGSGSGHVHPRALRERHREILRRARMTRHRALRELSDEACWCAWPESAASWRITTRTASARNPQHRDEIRTEDMRTAPKSSLWSGYAPWRIWRGTLGLRAQ